jgi:hypothetical protein
MKTFALSGAKIEREDSFRDGRALSALAPQKTNKSTFRRLSSKAKTRPAPVDCMKNPAAVHDSSANVFPI